jgi:predicted small secreted protein
MKRVIRLAIVAFAVLCLGGCSTFSGIGRDLIDISDGLRYAWSDSK